MIKVTRYNAAGKVTHMAEVRTLKAAYDFLDRVGRDLPPEPVRPAEVLALAAEPVAQERPEFEESRKRASRRKIIARDVRRANDKREAA